MPPATSPMLPDETADTRLDETYPLIDPWGRREPMLGFPTDPDDATQPLPILDEPSSPPSSPLSPLQEPLSPSSVIPPALVSNESKVLPVEPT